MNRELRLALLLVLLGAGLLFLAGGQDWVDAAFPAQPPLPPTGQQLTGTQVAPALRPLALLGLAGLAALAATKGRGRIAVGVLLAASGAAAVAAALSAVSAGVADALARNPEPGVSVDPDALPGFTPWVWPAVAGGVLLALGGLVVAVRGRRWAALSARYEAPGTPRPARETRPEVAAWDALDRGEDPTRPPDVGPRD